MGEDRQPDLQLKGQAPVLVLILGDDHRLVHLEDEITSIGRDPGCDVTIADDSVQERHCIIQKSGSGHEIFDLTDGNGILRNGSPVTASKLEHGDELKIGGVQGTYVDPSKDILPEGMQLLFNSLPPTRSLGAGATIHARTGGEQSFDELFIHALRKAPWILLSGVFHAMIFLVILLLFGEETVDVTTPPSIQAVFEEEEERETAEPEIDDEIQEEEIDPEDYDPDENPEELLQAPPDTIDSESTLEGGPPVSGSGFKFDPSGSLDGGASSLKGASGDLRHGVQKLRSSGLDIAFLIDATGSMDAEISACKTRLGDMIALLESFGIQFRIAVIAYRDKNDEFVTRSTPLTSLRFKAVAFLDKLSAQGGDDTPEAVYEAILEGTKLRWSARARKVMVLVGDAPPHEKTVDSLFSAIARFTKKNGSIHTIYTETAGGFDLYNTRRIFHRIAVEGLGRSVELDREDRLVEEILCLALNSQNRPEIRQMITNVSSGWKGKFVRERLKAKDTEFVIAQLSAKRMRPVIPLELMRENTPNLLGAYLTVLRDRKVPLSNRWLTNVLLKRLLARIDKYQDIGHKTRVTLGEIHPEMSWNRQQRLLAEVSKSLYKAGLLD